MGMNKHESEQQLGGTVVGDRGAQFHELLPLETPPSSKDKELRNIPLSLLGAREF